MFVLLFAVPALLVVVVGYVIGHGLWTLVAGHPGAEVAGWVTGLLVLAATGRLLLLVLRRRRASGGGGRRRPPWDDGPG